MNRTYINRQISLHKVGLDINEIIRKYYNLLNRLCKNTYVVEHDNKKYCFRDEELIFEYNTNTRNIWIPDIHYYDLQNILSQADGMNHAEKSVIVHTILENIIGIKHINSIFRLDDNEVNHIEETILSINFIKI